MIIFNSCSAEFTDNNDNNINLQPNELESDNQIMTDFSTIGFIESFLKNGVSGSISRSLSKETQAIIDDLIAKDAVDPFIDQMVYNFGYPSWQNILLSEYETYGQGVTAFLKPNTSGVSAVMYSAKQNDGSYLYSTYSREDIL